MNFSLTRKTLLASSIALTLGASQAHAALVKGIYGFYSWSTDRANFTMLDSSGYIVGGTNDVALTWDGNAYNQSSDYTGPGGASNMTMSSSTPFYGHLWTAHDIQIFVPGNYSFDTTLGGGVAESGIMNVSVPVGDIGIHLLFDWNGGLNMDMFVVGFPSGIFGSGVGTNSASGPCSTTITNCLWTGPGWVDGLASNAPTGTQVWMLSSTDGNGDGVVGVPMASGGPFGGYNPNFNAIVAPTPVPVPATAWLFGSGVLGLIAAARRRKDRTIAGAIDPLSGTKTS